jgi:hypothetical protein
MADRARAAAVALSRRSDDASLGVELLRDIRDVAAELGNLGIDHIRSNDLVNKLGDMSDRPWAEMPYTGKPITQPQLAKLLKAYRIRPKQIRFGGQTFKGYEFAWFATAFRYIPSTQGDLPETSKQSQNLAKNAETSSAFVSPNVSAKTAEIHQCFGVSPISQGVETHTGNDPFDTLKDETLLPRRAS